MSRTGQQSENSKFAGMPSIADDRKLINAIPHPILLIGENDKVIFANNASEHFFGVGQSIMLGRPIHDFIPFASPLSALINEVRRKLSPINEYQIDISSPKIIGRNIVDAYGAPNQDNPEEIILMLQQRNMAQMIERKLTHRHAAQSISSMSAVLAHEIKNPLAGIKGAAQLLEGTVSHEDKNLTRLISEETDRICKLVDSFAIFGDQGPIAREPVNIHGVLNQVVEMAKAGFGSHIKFKEEYDPSLPPVPGDRDQLIQVFTNLIKNASEAIGTERSDGEITVGTAFTPGIKLTLPGTQAGLSLPLMISIRDNGPGIAASICESVFEPFISTKLSGTGLGLSLVAKLISDHGGTIEFHSEPENTVFEILLPMQTSDSNLDIWSGGHS